MAPKLIVARLVATFTAQRLSALLVTIVGAVVGAYAPRGMTLVQGFGAGLAVMAAVSLAVIVHRWPAPAKVRARSN